MRNNGLLCPYPQTDAGDDRGGRFSVEVEDREAGGAETPGVMDLADDAVGREGHAGGRGADARVDRDSAGNGRLKRLKGD